MVNCWNKIIILIILRYFIDIRNIEISENSVKIRIGNLLKHSRPGTHLQELILKSFPENEKLCIVKNLSKYIRQNETVLLVSYIKPYSKVSKDTISRWVKISLSNSGIDINKFKPHNVRSAVT